MRIKIIVKFKDGDSFEQVVKFNTIIDAGDYMVKTFSGQFILLSVGENNGILVKQEEIRCVYWEILTEE